MNLTDAKTHMDYLYSIALVKCGDSQDAQDLTQEVLLAALRHHADVGNVRSWLAAVLNNKYYDMLRRKYKLPTVSYDLVAQQAEVVADDYGAVDGEANERPDDVEVRREVAHLARIYREVVARHYLGGERVQDIADAMGIPKGTVLSRLSSGREQMRKGFETMREYDEQSYSPERLEISCYGSPGMDDEPWSLVQDDFLKQNILLAAYEAPLTAVEIAKSLGIAAAYVETALDSLVASELMQKVGNRYYTDFLISGVEDKLEKLELQLDIARENYGCIRECIREAEMALRELAWLGEMSEEHRSKCIYYYILYIFDNAVHHALRELVPEEEMIFPTRPNGGKWIAIGNKYPMDWDFSSYKFTKYCYGGERKIWYDNFLSEKSICLHVYDTQPELNDYIRGEDDIREEELCKLLYIIHKGIPAEAVAFDPINYRSIPKLVRYHVLAQDENGKPRVDIPVISKAQSDEMQKLHGKYVVVLRDVLIPIFRDRMDDLRVNVPAHLEDRIMESRKYSAYGIVMAVIKRAIAEGDFISGCGNITPPMVLVIDR